MKRFAALGIRAVRTTEARRIRSHKSLASVFSVSPWLVILSALTVSVAAQKANTAAPLQIHTLSTRPELVTGGDVLLQIAGPANLAAKNLTVRANGRDVSGAFKPACGCAQSQQSSRAVTKRWPAT